MKIKKVAALCKNSKCLTLFNAVTAEGEVTGQYISNGSAVYPLGKLPLMKPDEILRIFDVSEKQSKEWHIREDILPREYTFNTFGELPIQSENFRLTYHESDLLPLKASFGEIFLNVALLAPVAKDIDEVEFYERKLESGFMCIVVKKGLDVLAIAMPYLIKDANFLKELHYLSQECNATAEYLVSLQTAEDDQTSFDESSTQ